jgi:flagellar basal body P-ring formation protein FlgA
MGLFLQSPLYDRRTGPRSRSCPPPIALIAIILFSLAAGIGHAAAASNESIMEMRIVRFIKEIYPGDSVRVRLNSVPMQLKEKGKIVNLSFARVPDSNGNGICSVEIETTPGRSRVLQVPFKVFTKKELFVLKQAAQKGDVIGPKDIYTRETYTNGKMTGYPACADDVIGKALKRDVSGNMVITDQVLEDTIAVKKGAMVIIIAESNKIIVQAKGKAVDKGRIGETIRVKNIASGRELTAKVVSGNAVKVEF